MVYCSNLVYSYLKRREALRSRWVEVPEDDLDSLNTPFDEVLVPREKEAV